MGKLHKGRVLGSQGQSCEPGARSKRLHLSDGGGSVCVWVAPCSLDPSALASVNPNLLPSLEQVLESLRELGLGQATCMFTVQTVTFGP